MIVLTLRCPHCGKKPRLDREEEAGGIGSPYDGDWVIECCARMSHPSLTELLKTWDKRAPEYTMPVEHRIPDEKP